MYEVNNMIEGNSNYAQSIACVKKIMVKIMFSALHVNIGADNLIHTVKEINMLERYNKKCWLPSMFE